MSLPKRAEYCTSTRPKIHAFFFLVIQILSSALSIQTQMTPSTSSLQPQEKGINLQIKLMIREVNLPKNRTAREKLY